MKKILLTLGLCMLITASFAQKKAVKDAKSAMNEKKFSEARELLKPALTDSETVNDADTWKTLGDIENKAYEDENLKQLTQKPFDEKVMYESLSASYDPYIKADQLGQLPDEKGKVKNKVRKDIASIIKANQSGFVNGGVYYNNQKEYLKASDMFEKYWTIPSLDMFSGGQETFNTNDSTFQIIKYYAVVCAIQGEDNKRAIRLLKKITEEPFTQNSTYKESDVYELLASQYSQINDSVNFLSTVEVGAEKFPRNKYFTSNLVNEYIKKGETDKAIAYLDKALANDPTNICDITSVKASLYYNKADYETADKLYETVLNSDPNCERALDGLSLSYIVQALKAKDEAGTAAGAKEKAAFNDKAKSLSEKSIPILVKYKNILEARNADDNDLKIVYARLENVYYNLNMDAEMKVVSNKLKKITGE